MKMAKKKCKYTVYHNADDAFPNFWEGVDKIDGKSQIRIRKRKGMMK